MTGGIAEGKSTVLGYLASMGFSTLSADSLARELFFEPDVQENLAILLGQSAPVAPDQLRAAIGLNPQLRRASNRLFHPKLLERLSGGEAEFVEVPLLVETCLQGSFDEVWVVTCGLEAQLERLSARVGVESANQLLSTQLSTEIKIPFADVIVRTNQPEDRVLDHVRRQALSGSA